MREKQRMKKEGIQSTGGDSDAEPGGGEDGEDGEDDDLFGPDEDGAAMDVS